MAKATSTNKVDNKKDSANKTDTSKIADTTQQQSVAPQQPQENIAQPDKTNPDSQASFRENARTGESVHTPMGSETMRRGDNVVLTEGEGEKEK